jgi:hypothetical protein
MNSEVNFPADGPPGRSGRTTENLHTTKALPKQGLCGGAPSGFRTPDPLIKSQLLYQLS